ncbi:hypothetical protein MPTK1_8g06950 [Marchantia polymorpha subsp. ruderalis]|uniref:Alpha-helical coiled-coil rod protein n=1 Tax=Marchantia polymorpha TaxID=3197 RepID=A0A2R6XID1_MARPO|nr:hypothetical protein MARPO_0013s0097 [Marchantia polymorpha]BBN18975.1 hypothetical protein Mp_8g06950 [Marchantia polymorpha subsp. ruderalis]|eukprot:PTQ45871.1 hypothetical protein MARPO_0013s0097 [Marchantia polymorpha]
MEKADDHSISTAEGVIVVQQGVAKPCKGGNYESFESFMQTLAPLAELPGIDEVILPSSLNSAIVGKDETTISAASEEVDSVPDEIKRLRDLVALLQIRLDATSKVVEIQETELCSQMDGDEESKSKYEKLLTRWRREVCILLLKQRVDALQVEQQRLQRTQKEQHLTVQLHEARALIEVLKQKERNLQAEIGILTTGQKLAEMTMRAEAARRKHEMEGTVTGVTRAAVESLCSHVDEHSAIMFLQLERLADAFSRLDLYVRRLSFSEHQVMMVLRHACSDTKPTGTLTHREKVEENIEKARAERRRDRAAVEQFVRRSANDNTGRANQLEVLLAATKSQLTEECLHARELQERIGKAELEGREAVKKATRKAQEQAERDLVAIKRQHSQTVQSLQQKISKLQNEHTKSIVAHHQLERKLSQQQQEFVQTLNQRDNEFRKSLDAKEIEVNGLLDEQNALLNKLKKFWRPILNSSAAKIFADKTQRSQLHTPQSSQSIMSIECKPEYLENSSLSVRSVETQTAIVDVKRERKKPLKQKSNSSEPAEQDNKNKKETKDKKEPAEQENNDKKEHKDKKDTTKVRRTESQSLSSSRLSTPAKKTRQDSKLKKTEEDLISSYLTKLQKSYVSSGKQPKDNQKMNTRSLDSLLEKNREAEISPVPSSPNGPDHLDSRAQPDPSQVSQSCRSSTAFSDCPNTNDESLPQYIICIPPQDPGAGKDLFVKSQRKKQAAESSTIALQEKLENLEALSESLLGQRM